MCVDIINTTRPFKRQTAPGRILGDMASVHGKIFTAFKPAEERAAVLAEPIPQRTVRTITDPAELSAELDSVISEGVAYDIEGMYLGTCAVGAPVRDQLGAVVAAMSVVMPTGRFGPSERVLCTEAVKKATASFSAYLGWIPRDMVHQNPHSQQ